MRADHDAIFISSVLQYSLETNMKQGMTIMDWFWRAAAPVGLLLFLAIGVCLILIDQTFTGLSLLALAIPLQWMLMSLPAEHGHSQPAPAEQVQDELPWRILIAFGMVILFLALAFLKHV
jgi:hypothetical protein